MVIWYPGPILGYIIINNCRTYRHKNIISLLFKRFFAFLDINTLGYDEIYFILNYGNIKRILGVYNILKMEILTISKFCSPCITIVLWFWYECAIFIASYLFIQSNKDDGTVLIQRNEMQDLPPSCEDCKLIGVEWGLVGAASLPRWCSNCAARRTTEVKTQNMST